MHAYVLYVWLWLHTIHTQTYKINNTQPTDRQKQIMHSFMKGRILPPTKNENTTQKQKQKQKALKNNNNKQRKKKEKETKQQQKKKTKTMDGCISLPSPSRSLALQRRDRCCSFTAGISFLTPAQNSSLRCVCM